MKKAWTPAEYSIADLVELIDDAKLALPRFQRPPVWRASDWIPFLTSVLLNRPTGTLLMLAIGGGHNDFAPRPIDGAPVITSNLKWLLLDGQQRMTSLYRALKIGFEDGHGKVKHVVIDVAGAIADGEVTEAHLEMSSGAQALNDTKMAKSGKVRMSTLLNSTTRYIWTTAYAADRFGTTEEDLKRALADIEEAVPAFSALEHYSFPALTISDDAPLDVVVDIFENMNRRGQRLNPFDLMVARVYKPIPGGRYFDLRQSWIDELAKATSLSTLGVGSDDGMLPLQLIAMEVSRHQDAHSYKVRGLANKDVLELPAEQIIGLSKTPGPVAGLSLKTAVKALDDAASFLMKHCGVIAPNLLPQQSMLLPLADQFRRPANARLTTANMKAWFFAAALSNRYYGSVNSYAQTDCGELKHWAEKGAVPTLVAEFDRKKALSLDLQQPFSREGNIVGSALMALLISAGALDWRPGQLTISSLDEDVHFHHMVPEKRLKELGFAKEQLRPIAGLTPTTASRNAAMRNEYPSAVMSELKKNADPILATHCVDRAALVAGEKTKSAYQKFVAGREKALREFVIAKLAL